MPFPKITSFVKPSLMYVRPRRTFSSYFVLLELSLPISITGVIMYDLKDWQFRKGKEWILLPFLSLAYTEHSTNGQ